MAQYSIELESKDIIVNANYESGFTSIDSIDFGGCDVSLTSALSGNTNLTAVTNGTIKGTDITSLFQGDNSLADASDLKFKGAQVAVSAFASCSNLNSVDLSDSEATLTSLASAFRECGIKEVNLPNTVALTSINRTFSDTPNLTSVTIDASHVVDAEGAFGMKISSTKVLDYNLGSDLSQLQVGKEMFGSAIVATTSFSYVLPSLTNADGMFKQSNFNTVMMDGTSSLTNANLCFSSAEVESVTFTNTDTIVTGSQMFRGCKELSVLMIPTAWTALISGNNMFSECTKLSNVVMDTPALTNAYQMFANDTNLTAVTLSDLSNVTNNTAMFSGCTNLTSAKLGKLNSSVKWDLSNLLLDDKSTTYIANNAESLTATSIPTLTFNDAVSANTNYGTAYATLTGKGWTVSPVYVQPAVATINYTDIDGTGENGLEATEAPTVATETVSTETVSTNTSTNATGTGSLTGTNATGTGTSNLTGTKLTI